MKGEKKDISFFEELTDELVAQTENLPGMKFEEEKNFVNEIPKNLNKEIKKTKKVLETSKSNLNSPSFLPDIPFHHQKGFFDMSSMVSRDLKHKTPIVSSKLNEISNDLEEKKKKEVKLEEPGESNENKDVNLKKVKESFVIPKKVGLGFKNKDNNFYKGIKDNVEIGFEPEKNVEPPKILKVEPKEIFHREAEDMGKLKEIKPEIVPVKTEKIMGDKFMDYSKFKEISNLLEQTNKIASGLGIHSSLNNLKSLHEKTAVFSEKSYGDADEIIKDFAKIDKLIFSKV